VKVSLFFVAFLENMNFINKKTKPTTVISTFKTGTTILGLVFSISYFFINTISQGKNWSVEKIPNCAFYQKISEWNLNFGSLCQAQQFCIPNTT
jgi:hypothetical protein